ncbi:hypothetical protein jhhlp_002454 [Lomentospora prolificans]|uniref:Rrp15p-domain-containing protein n=1 Tax=Lomentospora prolificans TaxID=41688 RepID=A0A2N3NE38_9PEZI|nr:hypothetical protein jhhlp_002454 [Lomentospora prolificans]
MAGRQTKKRGPESSASHPLKKRRKQPAYESDSEPEPEEAQDFSAVNLLDSEDDIENAKVDDGAATDADSSSSDEEEQTTQARKREVKKTAFKPVEDDGSDSGSDSGSGDDWDDSPDVSDAEISATAREKRPAKRNDPSAFATSLSKILSTKLSTTKRSDPVLARSADAQSSARAAADSVLEVKARKHMKEEKLKALEKGRIRDVMAPEEGTGRTMTDVLDDERRLRRVAQRGVVKLFNAVRAAQTKAAEASKKGKDEGIIGMNRREEKVNEMSKKGFLDLIASGGGKLKKGPLEEA